MKTKTKVMTMALAGAMALGTVGVTGALADQAKNPVPVVNSGVNIQQKTVESTNSLFFNYDKEKYELVQFEGESMISLMDKDDKDRNLNTFISWDYIPNQDIDTAAKEKIEEINGYDGYSAKSETSDLKLPAAKVVDYCEEDGLSMTYYFIDDNAGGVYKVFINTLAFDAFSSEEEAGEILDSFSIISKDENTNLQKIKTLTALG